MKSIEQKLGFSAEQEAEISAQIQESVQEASFNAAQVEDLARNSLDFLAGLAMPSVFRYFFPDLYKQAWAWLVSYVHQEREFPQLALGLPRGFAKSTFVKLFVLYVILFTGRKFILICAHDVDKAKAIVADVMDFLNEPNIRKIFGNWELGAEMDQQKIKKFGFRGRNINIAAGTIDTVRGLNLKHERPDIMIFDDIQDRKDAESEVISRQIETDLYGTAMKAKSPHGCLFIFIANMYPTRWSLLRKIKSNPTWVKFIVGGILANGQSIWEELQPIRQLLREFSNDLAAGKPEVFYAEVLNDETANVNHLFDISKIPQYNIDLNEIHQGNFVIIDPATDKANADAVSIMYFEVYDTHPVCIELREGRFSPGETIRIALEMCLRRQCRAVGIESNAYQYSLNYWFNFICTQQGIIGIESCELYSGNASKPSRILEMFKAIIAGEILIHPKCLTEITLQITQYNPFKRDNIDGLLDCLTYAPKMIELYGHLIAGNTYVMEQSHSQFRILEPSMNSPF